MSQPHEGVGDAFQRTVDELELQAWLARAEFRNPSLREPAVREELDALARLREELRVQFALGGMEARDRWQALEARWTAVKAAADRAGQEVGESVHDVLRQIRDGYRELVAKAKG
jgi:hypothetical protein